MMAGSWLCPRARRLHARHCKGCATILADRAVALSPVHGLLLSRSARLSLLWEAGAAPSPPPAAALARALFHRHEPQEELRPTRNLSLVGAHLTPPLAGLCLGLALRGAGEAAIRRSLRAHGVASLARRSRVSVARFVRFVLLLQESVGAPRRAPCEAVVPAGLSGAQVLLCFLWLRAADKQCLLSFLLAAARELPAGSLLAPSAAPSCERWREEWLGAAFAPDEAYAASDGAVRLAAALPPQAEGLELLAYALTSRGNERPEVVQQRFGFGGALPQVPDCVEACLREVISLALWDFDTASFCAARLPPSADPRLRRFFLSPAALAPSSAEWFDLCSARPSLRYLSGSRAAPYELHPSVATFVASLGSLLGASLPSPPPAPSPPLPLWPGCPLGWQLGGPPSRPVLLLQPLALDTAGAAAPSETLRIVFSPPDVHCYALRSLQQHTPPWVDGCRLAWLQAWRERCVAGGVPAAMQPALMALLGKRLLHALEHQRGRGEAAAAAAELMGAGGRVALLAATSHGEAACLQGLRVVMPCQAAWWLLPLLLKPSPGPAWDDLTLGSCAEYAVQLSDGCNISAAARAALAASSASDAPLNALLALHWREYGVFGEAMHRCTPREFRQVMRIVWGFACFSLPQKLSTLGALTTRTWTVIFASAPPSKA
ncbi:hypothetical protein AB1Y20_023481 [Prymnesium parvum]|uniref:Uncharacterized protein n=1 Tax=Prymnesium parvum TaxID=97485 RepID=A0AB34JGI2_PRYPA